MDVKPRFRIGPFQVSGGNGLAWLIVLGVLLLCCCGPIAANLSQR